MTKLPCLLALVAALASCGHREDSTSSSSEPATTTQLSTSTAGLTPIQTAKGKMIRLDGRFENAVIAHRTADGAITTECHDQQAEADAFMHGTSASATKVEVQ